MRREAICFAILAASFASCVAAQTVTGSGTSGTVPVFNGTSSITNSPVSISSTNVGIGTSSPGQKLEVSGNVRLSHPTYPLDLMNTTGALGIAAGGQAAQFR